MKKFNARIVNQIKNIFKANEKDYKDLDKVNKKIAELEEERETLQANIALTEQRVKNITGGYTSDQIYTTVMVPKMDENGVQKRDANGYLMSEKKYVLLHPDTIIPVEEPTPGVTEEAAPTAEELANAEAEEGMLAAAQEIETEAANVEA